MAETGLNRNERKALRALLQETSVREAARKSGLGERTLYRYLSDDRFTAALRRRQDELTRSLMASLIGLSGDAVRVLKEAMQSSAASWPARIRAALGFLAERRQAVELADLAERVAQLERQLTGGGGNG